MHRLTFGHFCPFLRRPQICADGHRYEKGPQIFADRLEKEPAWAESDRVKLKPRCRDQLLSLVNQSFVLKLGMMTEVHEQPFSLYASKHAPIILKVSSLRGKASAAACFMSFLFIHLFL